MYIADFDFGFSIYHLVSTFILFSFSMLVYSRYKVLSVPIGNKVFDFVVKCPVFHCFYASRFWIKFYISYSILMRFRRWGSVRIISRKASRNIIKILRHISH